MKKTDEQLQQEVAEIRRFVNGDSKQTAKKVIPIHIMQQLEQQWENVRNAEHCH